MYCDPEGHWFETVFDLFSLGVSVVEVVINPLDPWAWVGLAGDAVDLIPFVTGVGESIKGARIIVKTADVVEDVVDTTADTIKIVKAADRAADFTDTGMDLIRGLDKTADGFTISKHTVGTKIHYNFMENGKYLKKANLRVDGLDEVQALVFELKPYNKRGLRQGIKQIIKYQKELKKIYKRKFKMFIVLY